VGLADIRSRKARLLARGIAGLVLACILWQVLTGGRGWGVGGPFVALAVVSILWFPLSVRRPVAVWASLSFVGFFLVGSLGGGFDVARRALDPRQPTQPGWLRYPLRLPLGAPTTLFVGAMNLLPGTLGVELEEQHVLVHTLGPQRRSELQALEERIACVFHLRLQPGKGSP
jgi:multicomponent Na+:H+ antiporter subunit E